MRDQDLLVEGKSEESKQLAAVCTYRPSRNAMSTISTARGIKVEIEGESAIAAAARRPVDNPATQDAASLL